MALKRFTTPSIESSALVLLPSKNPIISYIEYPNGKTSASSAGGETIIIHGYNFRTGINVYIDTTLISVATRIDGTRISFVTTPLYLPASNRDLYVVNSDGTSAMYPPRFQTTSVGPTWTTAAGSLGTVDEFIYEFSPKATSDSIVTYSLISGAFPVGYQLNSLTGKIYGSHNIPSQTLLLYSFTLRATDQEGQYSDRDFSITFQPTFPTWVSSAALPNGAVGRYYSASFVAVSNTVLQYIAAGALPSGLTLNALSGVLSGIPTMSINTTLAINAVDNENNTTQKIFSIVIV
jgi:hypothetical protein